MGVAASVPDNGLPHGSLRGKRTEGDPMTTMLETIDLPPTQRVVPSAKPHRRIDQMVATMRTQHPNQWVKVRPIAATKAAASSGLALRRRGCDVVGRIIDGQAWLLAKASPTATDEP